MGLFTDFAHQVASARDLVGEIEQVSDLPQRIDALSGDEAVALLDIMIALGRLTDQVRAVVTGVISRRSTRMHGHDGIAQSRGHRSTETLLQHLTGVSRAEAAKQVRAGTSIFDAGTNAAAEIPVEDTADASSQAGGAEPPAPGPDLTDVDLDHPDCIVAAAFAGSVPWHEAARQALLHGGITTSQHDAIKRGLGQPPGHDLLTESPEAGIPCEPGLREAAVAEAHEYAAAWATAALQLVEQAPERTVEDLAKAARSLRDELDPVGAEQRFNDRFEARSFRMWTEQNGQSKGLFVFDDVTAAWVRSVLDAALRPRRGGPRFVDPDEQAAARELADDPRTNDQLAFDLMFDVLRAGTLADAETVFGTRQAGVRLVQVVQPDDAADDDATEQPIERATETRTRWGDQVAASPTIIEDGTDMLPAWVARQQACTSGAETYCVDPSGNPLFLGRTQRLFSSKQRTMLAIRDGGCRWPGCDRPASYCESHHIDPWESDHGRTDVDRGILLCRYHHLHLHQSGWRITRDGPGDFELHAPDGTRERLVPKVELRYAWAGIDPPPRRYLLAA